MLCLVLGVSLSAAAAPPPPEHPKIQGQATVDFAQSHGVDPATATIQTDERGAKFISDDQGNFVIQYPKEEAGLLARTSNQASVLAADWSAGACAGSFTPLTKLNNTVTWGGSESCVGSDPNALYPHYLNGALRATCAGEWPFCGLYSDEAYATSNNDRYSRVANIYAQAACDTSENYRFMNSIRPVLKGTQYRPFESASVVLPCNVTA